VAQGQVVLGLDVLDPADGVGQGEEAADDSRLGAGEVAGDGAVGHAALRASLLVVARRDEHAPVEDVGVVGQKPVRVDVHAVAVLVEVAGGHRDVLGGAGRPRRGGEQQRVVGGEHVRLAGGHSFDPRCEVVVGVDRDGHPVVGDRPDTVEAVLPPVVGGGVAAADLEQLVALRFGRVPGGVVEVVGVAVLEPRPQQTLHPGADGHGSTSPARPA
jgi:hypothetical protein